MIYLRPSTAPGDVGAVTPVDVIPRDEVCTVYIPGTGITTSTQAEKLGAIVQDEVFGKITNVSNYIVVYHPMDLDDDAAERGFQLDRRGGNIIPELKLHTNVYFNDRNLHDVFRRKIAPVLRAAGPTPLYKMRFAFNGDTEIVIDEFIKLLRMETEKLGFSPNDTETIIRYARANMRPYNDYRPEYINTLFKKIILPRISDDKGLRIDANVAATNMRKINILTHCHGAYVAQTMAELTENKMRELGYTSAEVNKILSQLLVVAFAPACTMEKSKYRFCAFMSMSDSVMDRARNWFDVFAWKNMHDEKVRFDIITPNWEWDFAPIVVEHNNVSTFVIKRRFEYDEANGPKLATKHEHNNTHYYLRGATNDGQTMAALARNVTLSGVKNSLAQTGDRLEPLPATSALILDGRHDAVLHQIYQKMSINGKKFMADVYRFAVANLRKIHPQGDAKIVNIKQEIRSGRM